MPATDGTGIYYIRRCVMLHVYHMAGAYILLLTWRRHYYTYSRHDERVCHGLYAAEIARFGTLETQR